MGVVRSVVIVMVAEPDLLGSLTDVAVSVTLEGLGAVAGAVYVTEDEVELRRVPQGAPEHPDPERLQVTP